MADFLPFSPAWRACALAAVLSLLALGLSTPAHADKPEWAGSGKKEQRDKDRPDHKNKKDHSHQNGQKKHKAGHGEASRPRSALTASVQGPRVDIRIGGYFGEPQRVAVQQVYASQLRAGHCPPGLAKKGKGCMPPGQAKKAYVLGRPLPAGVIYHHLPPAVSIQLGVPPAGHRFVRVATDILLIAVGTGMVIDAIEDLGSVIR